jgi:antitoxin MazE
MSPRIPLGALRALSLSSTIVLYSEETFPKERDMVRKITLRRVGGSIGATLPKDMADRLHVKPGDEVFAIETEQGILLTPYDPTFERAMAAYQRTAGKYRNALRELSK